MLRPEREVDGDRLASDARLLLRRLRFTSFALKMAMKFVSKEPVTAEDLASAPELEPALESLLRSLKAHDSVIE